MVALIWILTEVLNYASNEAQVQLGVEIQLFLDNAKYIGHLTVFDSK